jgi:hypothetical protein
VPATGYKVAGWTGACAYAGNSPQCVLTNIQANQAVGVSFVNSPPPPPQPIPVLPWWGPSLLSLLMLAAGRLRL